MRPPALTHPSAAVFLGDCLDVLAEMPDNSVDAIVCDPPYGLGFMGKAWDDLPPGLPWAQECLRVLKPGGHLLAFGGTRTWHRLAVAVEDAGFEVRDSIAWLYGSGFPKSLDVSKAIDKAGGNPLAFREFARAYAAAVAASPLTHSDVDRHLGIKSSSCYWAREDHRGGMPPRHHWEAARGLLGLEEGFSRLYDEAEREITGQHRQGVTTGDAGLTAAGEGKDRRDTPATPAAQQWQGWGTALKPAFEPIVVARKPLVGTVAANVLAHGTGALNIGASRVGTAPIVVRGGGAAYDAEGNKTFLPSAPVNEERVGRFPANVLLDGDAAAELDEQTGTLTSGVGVVGTGQGDGADGTNIYGKGVGGLIASSYGDSGGASRFFPTFRYQAKAPTRERPTVVAEDGTKTAHPTVKPLALMRWLVRLVTPPGGTVLDTFAGSGATVEAAIEEGFYALGIEREESYLPLIQVRLDRVAAPADPAA